MARAGVKMAFFVLTISSIDNTMRVEISILDNMRRNMAQKNEFCGETPEIAGERMVGYEKQKKDTDDFQLSEYRFFCGLSE